MTTQTAVEPRTVSPPAAKPGARGPRGGRAVSNAVMLLLGLYFIVPFWWLVVAATKSTDDNKLADYIGKVHERNACRSPWINTFDFRLNVGLPVRRAKVELTWDVLNLLNLFNRENGLLEYANFNDFLVVRPTAAESRP